MSEVNVDVFLDKIAKNKGFTAYRKELNEITGSVLATILLQQIVFYFKQKGNGFYKFKSPCSHELYKEGDSWEETLGFTKYELNGAIKKLKEKEILNTKTDMSRKTRWFLNTGKLSLLLINLYDKKSEIYQSEKADLCKSEKPIYKKAKSEFIKSEKADLDICNILTEITQRLHRDKELDKSNSKKSIKKDIKLLKNLSEEDKIRAEDFIEYRKQIKHPIKTQLALKAYLREVKKCIDLGFGNYEHITKIMKEHEWRTLKAEYLQNTQKSNLRQKNGTNVSEYLDKTGLDLDENGNIIYAKEKDFIESEVWE